MKSTKNFLNLSNHIKTFQVFKIKSHALLSYFNIKLYYILFSSARRGRQKSNIINVMSALSLAGYKPVNSPTKKKISNLKTSLSPSSFFFLPRPTHLGVSEPVHQYSLKKADRFRYALRSITMKVIRSFSLTTINNPVKDKLSLPGIISGIAVYLSLKRDRFLCALRIKVSHVVDAVFYVLSSKPNWDKISHVLHNKVFGLIDKTKYNLTVI